MPRLTLTIEQAAEWPPAEKCILIRFGTSQGYTRVAERNTWRPYAGRYGIGYVCGLGPRRGSSRCQDILYRIDPSSTTADGLTLIDCPADGADFRGAHWED